MSRFDEKSHKEISSELGISEKSVEYHNHTNSENIARTFEGFLGFGVYCDVI